MKHQKKRLMFCVSLILLCAFVLPLFSGCAKEETKTTTAEEVVNKAETEEDQTQGNVSGGTQSDSNGQSLQSTPNKGGTQQLTSGGGSVKSAYSSYVEALNKELSSSASEEEIIAARRDLAEATLRTMLTIKWSPKEDFEYNVSTSATSGTTYDGATKYVFSKDTVYSGLPYTNAAQSLEAHMLYVDSVKEDGTMVMDFTHELLSGGSTTARIGGNWEDLLLQAWNMVSVTSFALSATDMIPENGFLPVGDYEIPAASSNPLDDPRYDFAQGEGGKTTYNLIYDGSLAGDTDEICAYNGEQTMYEAYALLQKADGLIKCTNGTDAMMAVSVSVQRNPDGTINGEESKVIILKQTASYSDKEVMGEVSNKRYKLLDGSTCAAVDKEYTFKELFEVGYIPITVKELIDGSPLQTVAEVRDSVAANRYKQGNIYGGTITCTKRVAYVTMLVLDSEGNEVVKGIHLALQGDLRASETEKRYCFALNKITTANETDRYIGGPLATKTEFESGATYRNILLLTTVTGETLTVRDYTFVAS